MASTLPTRPGQPDRERSATFDRAASPGAGARVRRRAEIQARIGQAALELAEARGFDAVTADEIARAAGVSRATFFRHFPKKEAALFSWREAWLADLEQMVTRRAESESVYDAVERAFAVIGARYQRHRDHMVRHNAVVAASPALLAHEAALDRAWEHTVARSVAAGIEGDDRRAKWFGAALLGVLRTNVREWFEHDAETDLVSDGIEAIRWLVHHAEET